MQASGGRVYFSQNYKKKKIIFMHCIPKVFYYISMFTSLLYGWVEDDILFPKNNTEKKIEEQLYKEEHLEFD